MTKRTQNVRLVPRIPATSFSSCLGVFFLYQPYKHSRDHSSAPDLFVSVATHRLLFRDLLVTYTLYVTVPKHEIVPRNDLLAQFIPQAASSVYAIHHFYSTRSYGRVPRTPDLSRTLPTPPSPLLLLISDLLAPHDFHPLPLPPHPRKTHFIVYIVGYGTRRVSPPAAWTHTVLLRITVHKFLIRASRSPCD